MNLKEVQDLMVNLYEDIKESKQLLIDLDSVMGDGDLGITMEKVFEVAKSHSNLAFTDIGDYLVKMGFSMLEAAPSTMGTMISSGFLSAGKSLQGTQNILCDDWKLFFEGFYEGVKKRTKANVGEKTVLDVLDSIFHTLSANSFESEISLFDALEKGAKEALESTKDLVAVHGRAAYYKEKSVGHQDAGATVAYLMVKSFQTSVERTKWNSIS